MGFLTGAFLKSYSAVQRIRLQHQLTTISMRLLSVQRQSSTYQKHISRMKNTQSMAIKANQSQELAGARNKMNQSIFTIQNDTSMSDQDKSIRLTQINNDFAAVQQTISLKYAQQSSEMEEAIQTAEEMQLEPLKNEEEALTLEKNAIESQIKLIEGQEQAAAQMEKSSQKDFVPEYTGGGG